MYCKYIYVEIFMFIYEVWSSFSCQVGSADNQNETHGGPCGHRFIKDVKKRPSTCWGKLNKGNGWAGTS